MNILSKACITTLIAMIAVSANAAIITSTNKADFDLTVEDFNHPGFSDTDIVSVSGNITLDNIATGNPVTTQHTYTDWAGSILSGREYALSGDENFDVIFSGLQTAFAFTYEDDSIASLFSLTFLKLGIVVDTTSFTTSAFNTEQFIGFMDVNEFDTVQFRENDGASNSNEYFQFYTASKAPESVPEPSILLLMGLGLLGMRLSSRKK